MTNPVKIPHPLRSRTGASQRRRVLDALQPGAAPIDGRSLADILYFISQYATQVNFFEVQQDDNLGEYLETSDWRNFFEQSAPFQLARISKVDADQLEAEFLRIQRLIQTDPLPDNIDLLLRFILSELIQPVTALHQLADGTKNSLAARLAVTVKTTLFESFQNFVGLHNAANAFLCTTKISFLPYTAYPWQLGIDKAFYCDPCVPSKGNRKKAARLISERMNNIFYPLLAGFKEIQGFIPAYLDEALIPLEANFQQKHEPHLALLFAFLDLFKYFQGDLNQMGQKHLDFFYKEVLRIVPKKAVPDKAHLVFEIAKHLEQYKVKKDTLFLDGKDSKNQDIRFGLEDEVVIDKASVTDLRTLHLYPSKIGSGIGAQTAVEGVYIAPIANSADGKGKKFDPQNSANWAILGAKYSKCIPEGKDIPLQHPYGRIGFVLASPVLYLNEGKRKITVSITCPTDPNHPIHSECFENFISSLKNNHFYTFDESSIDALRKVFSDVAKEYLTQKLQTVSPWVIGTLQDFETEIKEAPHTIIDEDGNEITTNVFTVDEIAILECLTNPNVGPTFILQEMPFASAISYMQNLLEGQNPYEIGFEKEKSDFLNRKDTISCVPIFYPCLNKLLWDNPKYHILISKDKVQHIFDVHLSGKDNWIELLKSDQLKTTFHLLNNHNKVIINLEITLNPEDPAVVFYDQEKLKDKIDLVKPFPLMKVELNSTLQAKCVTGQVFRLDCCLQESNWTGEYLASVYHFLRYLRIDANETKITVDVCGVKNIVAQNDENIQDVNSPILPFGVRPKIGANFYIGSNEVLNKKWESIWVNVGWKDRPASFAAQYQFYDYIPYPAGSSPLVAGDFEIKSAVLDKFSWAAHSLADKQLFIEQAPNPNCAITPTPYYNKYLFQRTNFVGGLPYKPLSLENQPNLPFTINSKSGFIKLILDNVDFQHDRYTFVLTRQMMALADLVDPVSIDSAIKSITGYTTFLGIDVPGTDDIMPVINSKLTTICDILYNVPNTCIVDRINDLISNLISFTVPLDLNDGIIPLIDGAKTSIVAAQVDLSGIPNIGSAQANLALALGYSNDIILKLGALIGPGVGTFHSELIILAGLAVNIKNLLDTPLPVIFSTSTVGIAGVKQLVNEVKNRLDNIADKLKVNSALKLGLPQEPYTPTLKEVFLDYIASADKDDILLTHLYPFENTSKSEDLRINPTLLPTFTDEGTLFIGLKDLRPGASLNLLLQLAEATADSERNRAVINWNYLTGNRWLPLRTGFELIEDQSDGITVSGIVQFSIPEDISDKGNTIMPEDLFWIKASTLENTAAISEVIGIHAQAACTTALLLPANDLLRLDKALEAGSIAKLAEADFSIKSIAQPYPSFNGKKPEEQGSLYTRVSERLRHKDRGIQLYDFEHIILEAFPQIYKTKCISHSMGLSTYDYRRDLEVAPGFVELVVIPDLTKLIPGNRLEPRAPVSLLEQIADFLRKRISPFARLKVLNPRYEKVNVNITVQLVRGKSKAYYAQQLKEDLSRFLAPWYLGDSDKIFFGQTLRFSEVVGFVESLEYIENIQDINLKGPCEQTGAEIKAMTARSILTGGEICVLVVDEDCKPCVITKTRMNASGVSVVEPEVCEKQPVRFLEKKKT